MLLKFRNLNIKLGKTHVNKVFIVLSLIIATVVAGCGGSSSSKKPSPPAEITRSVSTTGEFLVALKEGATIIDIGSNTITLGGTDIDTLSDVFISIDRHLTVNGTGTLNLGYNDDNDPSLNRSVLLFISNLTLEEYLAHDPLDRDDKLAGKGNGCSLTLNCNTNLYRPASCYGGITAFGPITFNNTSNICDGGDLQIVNTNLTVNAPLYFHTDSYLDVSGNSTVINPTMIKPYKNAEWYTFCRSITSEAELINEANNPLWDALNAIADFDINQSIDLHNKDFEISKTKSVTLKTGATLSVNNLIIYPFVPAPDTEEYYGSTLIVESGAIINCTDRVIVHENCHIINQGIINCNSYLIDETGSISPNLPIESF